MSHDIPAEFLPPLPANRTNRSSVTRDARVDSMVAAMQPRPVSIRSRPESLSSSQGRPVSVRASYDGRSDQRLSQPRLEHFDPQNNKRTDRVASTDSQAHPQNPRISTTSRIEPSIPVVLAQVENPEDDARSIASSRTASVARHGNMQDATVNPMYDVHRNLTTPGNRQTLTLSDEEIASRLHVQLNQPPLSNDDGEYVTAEVVRQEILDRQNADHLLDAEISNLENQVMARQLDHPGLGTTYYDAGELEDEAWRQAMQNDKLDYMRPTSFKPYFSAIIFTITTITLTVEIALNGGIENFATNPTLGPSEAIMIEMGAKDTPLLLEGQYFRLVSPMILHAGILHWLFNMIGLWNIVVPMEREFGSLRITPIFIISGMFGIVLSCLLAPYLISVGASGAIFGLFGAAWADLIQNWSLYKGTQIRMFLQLLLMTIIDLLLGMMPFLDNYQHLGGLICGLIIGLGVLVQQRYYYSGVKKGKRNYQICLMMLSFILLPGMLVTGYTILFTIGPAYHCSWCVYVSCIPMPPNVPYNQRWWNCDACSTSGIHGTVDPTNNTLIFQCPYNGTEIEQSFPSNVTINTNLLIATCLARCNV